MPIKIINKDGKEVSEATVLAEYFKRKEESISEFFHQVKQLTSADKTELAIGVAKELGYTVVSAE